MASSLIIKVVFFSLTSMALIYVSRSSLRVPLTHGLPRFFAWEAIIALFLLNLEHWFRNPFFMNQILSWSFLVISLVLILLGSWTLRVLGKPGVSREDDTLLAIEKTTNLVTGGIYHFIRHPFYSSLLFLAWGIYLKNMSWFGMILVIVATVCLVFTAVIEEREDIIFFGPVYREYMHVTKRFIPFLF